MERKIKRIFISSTGRTGTQFFAKYMSKMIENSASLHEPGTPWITKPELLLGKVKDYGLYHMTLGQMKNTHSMYKLSRDYVAGDISKSDAMRNIKEINARVDSLYKENTCVYSSGHVYGLLGLLDEVYPDSRFVFIIRDPRDWIGSALNKAEYTLYGPLEIFIKKLSLQPSCIQNDPYIKEWNKLSKFEKYCWFYSTLNNLVLNEMSEKDNFRTFRYEDIFLNDDKVEEFEKMLQFATDFDSGQLQYKNAPDLLNKKVDSKQEKARANWESWSDEQAKILQKHCGFLMHEFGYGKEGAWKKKLGG